MNKHSRIVTTTLVFVFFLLWFGIAQPLQSIAQTTLKRTLDIGRIDKQTQQGSNFFLYLPFRSVNNVPDYMDTMTSVFDHSNPNYHRGDNRIVMFNGGIFDDNCVSKNYANQIVEDCAGPIQSFTDETWEYPRQYYNGHDGYDWAISGSVVAAASGIVTYEGWWPRSGKCTGYMGLGYMVIIDHENGYRTIYGHMQDNSSPFHKGQRVNLGQTIGTVGNTTGCGTSTGSHLHFQVEHWQWQNENWYVTDPFGWDISAGIDPLVAFNGESSKNLWVNGFPTSYESQPGSPPSLPLNSKYMGGAYIVDSPPNIDSSPTNPTTDQAAFNADVSLPDGTIVPPNQSLGKTWRVRNNGTSTWDDYKLVFQTGDQLNGPNVVDVPTTAPGAMADISVNLVAPGNPGAYAGYWRLRNAQGTYFGPTIWIKIEVQSSNSQIITTFTADPPSPANTGHVQFNAQINNLPNFRAMRLKIDGKVIYEIGAPVLQYDWNTNGYAAGDHTLVVEAATQTDTAWSQAERSVMTYRLTGTSGTINRAPHTPDITSPYDWYVYYSGNTANLCGQHNGDPDGDAIIAYYFEIFDSAQLWNSGWISSNCVTTGSLGPYNYQWRFKVRDSKGAESGWSDPRHFTLVNPALSITELYFQPLDGNSEQVRIRACTAGQGGVGITLRVSVNDATDGSSNGTWHTLKELGVPCFNEIDAPIWYTLGYGSGSHRIRVEARGNHSSWDGAVVREAVYSLPHRRPQNPAQIAPVPLSANPNDPIYLNSRTIVFIWGAALRTNTYTLHISTTPVPENDPIPVFRQTFDASVTQHTLTLNQDYPTLYWQVVATNDKGSSPSSIQRLGIDRTPPACSIQSLPGITYENVFQASWSSSDGNSGTRFTDIQYQDGDRGEWQNWLTFLPTAQTFDLFYGQSGHTYSFRCRSMDQAGNMGAYSASSSSVKVDPAARPIEAWWNANYSEKRSITVLNNVTNMPLPVDYPVHLRFDTTTTPSSTSIYSGSESANKCDDLRIVYGNTTELDRYISVCTSNLIEIWFRNQEAIPPATSNSSAYRLYYGYAGANNPPDNQTDIWYPLDDANTVGLWFLSEGSGPSIIDHSGYGNNGSRGALTWTTGIFGNALMSPNHDRGNGAFIPGSSSLGSSAFTLEFYAKRDDLNGGYLAGMGMSGNDRERMRLSIEGPGTIKFQVDPAPGGASDVWGQSICLPNLEWQHIAVTFDGNRTGKVYCGGVLAGSGVAHDPGISSLNFDLYLGSDFSDAGRFQGMIDQVRLSNIVRTSFPHAQFAKVTLPPSAVAGELMPVPVVGQPNLVLQTLRTHPSLDGGAFVELVVQNVGTKNTQNGFYTDLYIDYQPTGTGDYTNSLQFWVNDPIEAGQIVTLTAVITDVASINNALRVSSTTETSEVGGLLYAQVDSSGAVSEPNNVDNINSNGVDFCLASSDAYEGDATKNFASPITLGETQNHNFDHLGDQDWLRFEVQSGTTYILRTSNLGVSSDTYIYLYDRNGTTLLTSNDDYGDSLASFIEWEAPASGTYYILIQHWNPNVGGCKTNYDFTLAKPSFNIFLPTIIR